jgi:hypothetical protein
MPSFRVDPFRWERGLTGSQEEAGAARASKSASRTVKVPDRPAYGIGRR